MKVLAWLQFSSWWVWSLGQVAPNCTEVLRLNLDQGYCIPSNYSKDVLPQMEDGSPLSVGIDLILTEVIEVDDLSLTATLALYLEMNWREPRLVVPAVTGRANGTVTLMSLKQLEKFWLPDLEILRLAAFRTPDTIMPIGSLQLEPGKLLRMAIPVEITVRCPFVFNSYPLDQQSCPIRLGSFGYQSNLVMFSGSIRYENDYQRFLKYHVAIQDMPERERNYSYQAGDQNPEYYSTFGFDLTLTRSVQAHIMRTYLPSGVLVITSWISFLVNPSVVPGRMALLVTLLLVLINVSNSVSMSIPLANNLTAIEIWMLICLGFVFAAVIEYAYLLFLLMGCRQSMSEERLKMKKSSVEHSKQIPLHHWTLDPHGDLSEAKESILDGPHPLDKSSLILFPCSFLIFNTFYWAFLLL